MAVIATRLGIDIVGLLVLDARDARQCLFDAAQRKKSDVIWKALT